MKKAIITFLLILPLLVWGQGADFAYDDQAQLDESLKNRVMWGYKIMMFPNNPSIYFRKPDDLSKNMAYYNWKQQFWVYRAEDFDSSKVDLKRLFLQIDLSKTTLDRNRPTAGDQMKLEDRPSLAYNIKKDKEFNLFLDWMNKIKTPARKINFYKKAAANSAKRGASYDFVYGNILDINKVGMQYEVLKLTKYKGVRNGTELRKTPQKVAGGMQYYFELHGGKYLRSSDTAYNIFRDNKTVPVTVVELVPTNGKSTQGILRGRMLTKQVKSDLESYLKKNVSVTLKTMKLDYQAFGDNGKTSPLFHYNQYLQKHINPQLPQNTIIIYYLTNKEMLRAIDDEMTHPLVYGPYGTDWARMYATIIHELGHSLGMRHHVPNREGSNDIAAHLSPACVMNYRYKSQEFCELCRYALGVNK